MNGFSLQSTTTPRKACKGIESALVFIGGVLGGQSRLEKTCMVESDQGKHGGV
ncbi:unnamed protein product [Prunus brigantina]